MRSNDSRESSAFLPPAAFASQEPGRRDPRLSWWLPHGLDPRVNWDDVGPTLLHRAAGRLHLEQSETPDDPGALPLSVTMVAWDTCAILQELRAAGFDTDSDHPFVGDAWVTEWRVM